MKRTARDQGIGIDPRWERFEGFLADMRERPPGARLQRIDRAGSFSAENCRWVMP
jgi:hypothetical protein